MLQRGMNFHWNGSVSVILMSLRPGAPYEDRVEEGGGILIYEGHDVPKGGVDPKSVDQPFAHDSGLLTQNGYFFEAAKKAHGGGPVEKVRVYEKMKSGIWVYNGVFKLLDAWQENSGVRKVYKFRLELTDEDAPVEVTAELDHNRLIPSDVKREVWKRDEGKCVECGSADNLHFDHNIPFSKGGSSVTSKNVQLLCARHNLAKTDRIQ